MTAVAVVNYHLGPKDEVIAANLRLVHHFARKYLSYGRRNGVEYDDLYGTGCVGLVKAYNKFDPEKSMFSTYAGTWIKFEILRHIERHSGRVKIPRTTLELRRKAQKLGLINEPVVEIANRLGCSLKAAERISKTEMTRVTSIHVQLDEEQNMTVEDMIGTSDDLSEIEVRDFMSQLPARTQTIIKLRIQEMTQADIAAQVGLQQVQVSRILAKIKRQILNHDGR
ncbi:RNA polymerase sigma-B factor [Paenibacillus sp. UNCCL117]|uniref:sigma-70 family RNA polymerase sigma factor n=1 Tax=unclassified Paenibacillus TaxID=185978 RepID=UPI0008901B24|nr:MULTISPECIES: sigma-70 family RNA polymerase sigma factor [unclassified Paenibacillus]SDD28655.1 RNA polymerase sigma-B factor [Paenibacillus sp. cl123]SFW40881.1 RNA polymerase sigma-B factor [Paenibacillus sp. UNCCL117]